MKTLIAVMLGLALVYCLRTEAFVYTNKVGVTNTAVVVVSPDKGKRFLAGVRNDYERVKRLFKNDVWSLKVDGYYDPSQKSVRRALQSASVKAGKLGTIILYYSGHGYRDGDFRIDESWMDIQEVLAAIVKGRKQLAENSEQDKVTPLKRLVVISDACFSGQLTEGKNAAWRKVLDMRPRPVTELVVLAATQPNETAKDEPRKIVPKSMKGGRFTTAWVAAASLILKNGIPGGNITLGEYYQFTNDTLQFVHKQRWNHYGLLGKHTATYDFLPTSLSKENLFPVEQPQKKCLTQAEFEELHRLAPRVRRQAEDERLGRVVRDPMLIEEQALYSSLYKRNQLFGRCR